MKKKRSLTRLIAAAILHLHEKNKGKKKEFSKKLAVMAGFIMFLTVAISTILALLGRETISDVTVAAITTCGGYLCTYGIKSAFEKNSRNKYGIDESGVPYAIYGENNDIEEGDLPNG